MGGAGNGTGTGANRGTGTGGGTNTGSGTGTVPGTATGTGTGTSTRRLTAIAALIIAACLVLALVGGYLWDRNTQHAELEAARVAQIELDGATRVATIKHYRPWSLVSSSFVYPNLQIVYDVQDADAAFTDLEAELRAAGYELPPGVARVDAGWHSADEPPLRVEVDDDQIVLWIGAIEG